MSIQLQNFVSLTTTGTSGASTLTNGVLNVPNYDAGGSWVDYSATSTIVGWSSRTTTQIYYRKIGKQVFVVFNLAGTSNANNITITLPDNNNSTFITQVLSVTITDNGSGSTTPGRILTAISSNVITINRDRNATAFTTSGTKTCAGQFFYFID